MESTRTRETRPRNQAITIHDTVIAPGERRTIDLPMAALYTHSPVTMPVHVIHGKFAGPRLVITAAVHGDELNGMEIVRRLLALPSLARLRGTLIAAPIVNVLGVVHKSRYLPDRRDLNRSFPGSEQGSLASRLAHLVCTHVIAHATHGIDLHTAAIHRDNFPQIRADLDDPETLALARAFGAPVLLNAGTPHGSLRGAAVERGVKFLVYEAGEALRFDEMAIRGGVAGILNVMRALGMLKPGKARPAPHPAVAKQSTWVRASTSGILRTRMPLGEHVHKNGLLGIIGSPFGEDEHELRSPFDGIVIGRTTIPLVHEGEAVFHIASLEGDKGAERVESLKSTFADDELLPDEPVIV
ncbi:MAG TPA: succinylglutamate desuccinylase/aspartoacylase family protein [Gammaproteobacteria bacterium]|nr:succinylglutamate desuccinylase/aspartoacylase family protein [Gammaproteobacteria bacterium]